MTRDSTDPPVYWMGGHWGDAIQLTEIIEEEGQLAGLRVHGWKYRRPCEGDILLSNMESGRVAAFRFTEVTHCRDPADMFTATAMGMGYADELGLDEAQEAFERGLSA